MSFSKEQKQINTYYAGNFLNTPERRTFCTQIMKMKYRKQREFSWGQKWGKKTETMLQISYLCHCIILPIIRTKESN